MTELPEEIVALIGTAPLTHLSTINANGSPQVSVMWIGYEGGHVVSGHMTRHLKVRNMERDPRVVLSFLAPAGPGDLMVPYVVLKATAVIEESDGTWDLLDRLTKRYVAPDVTFPAPRGPGYTVRYEVEKVGGVGPWA